MTLVTFTLLEKSEIFGILHYTSSNNVTSFVMTIHIYGVSFIKLSTAS